MLPLACALTLAAASPAASPAEQLFAERLDPGALDRAIALLTKETAARPDDAPELILLARAEAFWSDLRPDAESVEADARLRAGIRAGGAALAITSPAYAKALAAGRTLLQALGELEPSGALALYWIAADQHRLASRHGLAWLLLEAPELRALFERVAALAPATFHGGAYRHLAELDLALPAGFQATLAGARSALDEAERLGPTFLGNSLVWAERYAVKTQDVPLFRRRLGQILSAPEGLDPSLGPENELARRRARALLAEEGELFTRAAIEAAGVATPPPPVEKPDGGSAGKRP